MKRILFIGGGAAVVVVVAVVAVLMFSGSIIKTVIEEVGSQATQAKVTVDDVKLSPMSGEGALVGLIVGNPKGFKSAQAFKLGNISLKLDTGTLTSDPIVVKEVVIASPEVTYELADSGADNIRTIQKNTQTYAGSSSGGGGSAGKPPSSPQPGAKSEKERKVIIENLYVRGGKVAVTATALGGKPLGTGLPDIHLTNIGKSKGGASPAEVADQVIGAIAKSAQTAVSKIGADQLKGLVGSGADDMMKKLGSQVPAGLPGMGSSGSASGSSPATNPSGTIDRLLGR